MSVEDVVSLSTAWRARSPALLAFGGDSAIELVSAVVVYWRFRPKGSDERTERLAARITGGLLLALAVYVALIAIFSAGGLGIPLAKAQGQQPRVANMLVEDCLRPAAVKVGILSSHRDDEGRLVDDDLRRFGFHNLRHSLASFLIHIRTDPRMVHTLLRHSDVKLTL